MHRERRVLPVFTCCDPIRQKCSGRDFPTMFDHARARAGHTGYTQKLHFRHGLWWVVTVGRPCKRVSAWFNRNVK